MEKISNKEGLIRRGSKESKRNYYDFIRINNNSVETDMIIINNLENRDNYLCISDLSNIAFLGNCKSGLSTLDFSEEKVEFNYDEETIKNANEGFLLWEEHEFEKAKEPLRLAAEKNYLYSMTKYGLILFSDIKEKQKTLDDFTRLSLEDLNTFIYAIDLLLKASIRGGGIDNSEAIDFFSDKIIKNVKEERFDIWINKIGYGPQQVFNLLGGISYKFTFTTEVTLLELLNKIPTDYIYKWLEGKYGTNKEFIKNYPIEIKKILQIYFLNIYYQTFNRFGKGKLSSDFDGDEKLDYNNLFK